MIALPFLLNSLFNFAVGILVAKALGPAEYGRYALALSIAVVMQTIGLDWLRLAATRYYSAQDRLDRPEIRSTLDLVFLSVAGLAALIIFGVAISGVTLPLSTSLIALAITASVSNALFDISAALLRARFLDKAYGAFVIGKNLLAAILIVGGAWYTCSAKVALAGLILSVAGSFAVSRRVLIDDNARPRLADRTLAFKFAAYGLPIVLSNVLYQMVPLINRGAVSQVYGFAEAGQLALAFDIGIRIVGSIGSGLDVFLFQIAVLAEKTFGAQAARDQVARNMGLVFAVVVPAVAGCWLILPSFECVFVPSHFHNQFGHYFTLMLPALLAFALINYGVAPAFQIGHRTLPLIVGGAVALFANCVVLLVLPTTADASKFAIAQSVSTCAGLSVIILLLCLRDPIVPRLRDIAGALVAVLVMLVCVAPMRASMTTGPKTMLLEACAGVLIYGALVFAFDVCQLRGMVLPRIMELVARRVAARARVSDGSYP